VLGTNNSDPVIKICNEHCGSVLELVRTIAFKSIAIAIVSHIGGIGLRRDRLVKDIPDTFQSFEKADEKRYQTVVEGSRRVARSGGMEDIRVA